MSRRGISLRLALGWRTLNAVCGAGCNASSVLAINLVVGRRHAVSRVRSHRQWPFVSFGSVVRATRRKVCASARCGGRRAGCRRRVLVGELVRRLVPGARAQRRDDEARPGRGDAGPVGGLREEVSRRDGGAGGRAKRSTCWRHCRRPATSRSAATARTKRTATASVLRGLCSSEARRSPARRWQAGGSEEPPYGAAIPRSGGARCRLRRDEMIVVRQLARPKEGAGGRLSSAPTAPWS